MRNFYYKLVADNPVPCTAQEAAQFFESGQHLVREDVFGKVVIQTIFLCFNAGLGFEEEPVFYRTTVSGGAHDGLEVDNPTREKALAAHQAILNAVTH